MKHLNIKIEKLELWGELILKDIDLTLNQNERISVVWPNGSGKTTFMKMLTWVISDFHGNIENVWNLSLGYMHQVYSDNEDRTVHDELKEAFSWLLDTAEELKKLEEKMATDNSDETMEDYSSLLEAFNNRGWYEYENKIHGVANGIGVLSLLEKKLTEISWWQRTKVALAKVLLEDPDMLFLDEPTNFIDIESVEWLESYLQNKWRWWYVIVSHDREFLDKTCNKTLEIQPQRAPNLYHTNYSDYLLEREKIEKKAMMEWERQWEYIEKQEQLINRFRAWSRAGWAKSRAKMIDKIEKYEKPYIPKRPQFHFNYQGESSEKMVSFKEAFIGRTDSLFFIQEIILYKWQKVWIVWDNWVGKSTFIKTILGQIALLEWNMSVWKSQEIIYYSQMHEELDKEKTIRENFQKHGFMFPDQHLIAIIKHIKDSELSVSYGNYEDFTFKVKHNLGMDMVLFDEEAQLNLVLEEKLWYTLSYFFWTSFYIKQVIFDLKCKSEFFSKTTIVF